MDTESLKRAVDCFAKTNILVIGDLIVDQFIWGSVSRISPEAPVPVVNVTNEELLLGGSANVLRNIVSLGGRCALCGIIGNDPMGETLVQLMGDVKAPVEGLVRSSRPTTVKTRVVAQGQQVVRYDREQTGTPSPEVMRKMVAYLGDHLADFDAVIVSDYAKGVINSVLMEHLHTLVRRTRKQTGKPLPLIVDPKPAHIHFFSGATVITPNNHEATLISEVEIVDEKSLLAAARAIRSKINCQGVLITRGEAGMALLEQGRELVTVPTMAKEVFDVTGAGDTVAATLALGLAAGCSMFESAVLANHAAGIVVGKVGTASVSRLELFATLDDV